MATVFERQFFICTISSFIAVFVFGQVCLAQVDEAIPDKKDDKESFMKLQDGIIKREIASFNITGSSDTETDSFAKIKVNEISVRNCTDSFAIFEKGDIITTDILVSIYSTKLDTIGHKLTYADSDHRFLLLIDNKPIWGTDGGVPKEKVKSVSFMHVKYQLILPDSAMAGLYEPNFCYKDKSIGKPAAIYCKVFQSVDKRRVYIYMRNGDGAGGYEVTWIIQDSKYFTRIVDYGF